MEDILKKPYTSKKERPYKLHAIMVHDGLADSGHYYTFIYDRVLKSWWKLNDQKATMETEETVMKEAMGGDGLKTGYYLVYINQYIADEIDKIKQPIFTQQFANKFKIPK